MKYDQPKRLEDLPIIFQTRIIKLFCVIGLLMLIALILLLWFDFMALSFPFFVSSFILDVHLFRLLSILKAHNYITITGTCVDVNWKLLNKKKVLDFTIDTSNGRLNIRKEATLQLFPGDCVLLYLTKSTPVYTPCFDPNGIKIIGSYLGIEIIPGGNLVDENTP